MRSIVTNAATEPQRKLQKNRPGRIRSQFPIHAVILDEALAGTSAFLDAPTGSVDPSTPNATVCTWSKAAGKYTQSEQRIAVANHSTTNHAIDTPGAAIPINGHYWFFGDCDPIASRPTPPWDEA